MDNGTLTASDVALLSGNGSNSWGDSSFMWVLALLILAGGGFNGGFGGNGYHPQYATQDFVQNGFNFNDLQDQNRDLMGAITAGTAQTVASVNQSFHDITSALSDRYSELAKDISDVRTAQVTALANQNQCCCETQRAIDGVNYNTAMQTASINQTTVEQTQKILDALTANRMTEMQNQINDLQLQNAMSGVLRYPNSWAYNAGTSPFCQSGCGCNCMSV